MKERLTLYENDQRGRPDLFPADALVYINGVLAPVESLHVSTDRRGTPEIRFTLPADKSIFRLGQGDSVDVMAFVYDAQIQRYGLRFWGDIVAWGKGRTANSTSISFTAVDKSYVIKNFLLEFVEDVTSFVANNVNADAGQNVESLIGRLSTLNYALYGGSVTQDTDPIKRPFDYIQNLLSTAVVKRAEDDRDAAEGYVGVTWPGSSLDSSITGTFAATVGDKYNIGTYFRAATHVKVAVGGTIRAIEFNHRIDGHGNPDGSHTSYIAIEHITGGMSEYLHVSTNLSVGDEVAAGDTLGFADGTGWERVPKVLGSARLTEYQNYAQGEFFEYRWKPSGLEDRQSGLTRRDSITISRKPSPKDDELIQNSNKDLIIAGYRDPLLLLGSPRFGTVVDSPLRLFTDAEDPPQDPEGLTTDTRDASLISDGEVEDGTDERALEDDTALTRFFDRFMRAWAMTHRFVASPVIEEQVEDEDYVFPVFKEVRQQHLLEMVQGATQQYQGGGLYHIIEALLGMFYFELQPITNPNFVRTDPETPGRIVDDDTDDGVPTLTNYVSKPVSVFTLPPRCNVFFDSVIESLNYSETYATQPTRVYMSADTVHTALTGAAAENFGHHTAYPIQAYERFHEAYKVAGTNPQIGPVKASAKNLIIWKEEYFRGPMIAASPTPPSYMALYNNRAPEEVIPGITRELAAKLLRRKDIFEHRKTPNTSDVHRLYRVSGGLLAQNNDPQVEDLLPAVVAFCHHPDIQLAPEVLAGLIAQESAWDHNAVYDKNSEDRQAQTLLQMFPGAAYTAYSSKYQNHVTSLLDDDFKQRLDSMESTYAVGAALIERAMTDTDQMRGRRLAIHMGGVYLKTRMDEFDDDYALALTAYHSGAPRVTTAKGRAGSGSSAEEIIAHQILDDGLADHSKEHALTHAAFVLHTANNIRQQQVYPGVEPASLTATTWVPDVQFFPSSLPIPSFDMEKVQKTVNEILKGEEDDEDDSEEDLATYDEEAVPKENRVYFRTAALHYYITRYRQRGGTANLIGDHPYVAVGFPGIFLDEKSGMFIIATVDRVEWSFQNGQVSTAVHFSTARLLDEAIADTERSRKTTAAEIDIGPAEPVRELQDLQRKETADEYYQKLFGCDAFSLEEFKTGGEFEYEENLWTDQKFLKMPESLQGPMQSYAEALDFNFRGVASIDECMSFLEHHTGKPVGRIGTETYHGAPYYRKLDFKYVYIDDNLEMNRNSLRNLYLQREQWTTRVEYLNRMLRGWHYTSNETGAATDGKSTINLVGGNSKDWGNVR